MKRVIPLVVTYLPLPEPKAELNELDLGWRKAKKTGQVKLDDPNFEELVKIVQAGITDEDFFLYWLIIWMLLLSPSSPISPLYE